MQAKIKLAKISFVILSLFSLVGCDLSKTVTRIVSSKITASLTTTDTLDSYLKETNFGVTVHFSDNSTREYFYNTTIFNDIFALKLVNPNNIEKSLTSKLTTKGTWNLTTSYRSNKTIYSQISFQVIKQEAPVLVDKITISPSNVELSKNEICKLTAEVSPSNATNKNYTWSSSDSSVATIDEEGIVKAIANGTAVIKATANDGSKVVGSSFITVKNGNYSKSYNFTDKNFKDVTNSWTCYSPGSGFNYGVQIDSNGYFKIESVNEFDGIEKLYIRYHTTSNISTSEIGRFNISYGEKSQTASANPTQYRTKVLEISFDKHYFGKVKVEGNAYNDKIFVEGIDLKIGEIVYPTSISLTASKTSLNVGESTTIGINYYPNNTTVKNVISFNSSNGNIASITSEGILTAKAYGDVIITAYVQGEKGQISSNIAISVQRVAVEGITLSPSSLSLNVGDTEKITAIIMPSNAYNQGVTWSSNNTSIATVDSKGNVKAIGEGSTTIKAKTDDGGFIASCSITMTSKTIMKETVADFVKKSVYNFRYCPSTGNPKLLIIPVWFTDSSSYVVSGKRDTIKTDIEKAFFGSSSDVGWRSVKTYYEDLSHGKVNLSGTVSDWYECGYKSSYIDNSNKTTDLVIKATNYYFSTHPSDSRKNYDSDKNGYLDGVVLIYGLPDSSVVSQLNDNYWAYMYSCDDSSLYSLTNPGPNCYLWASYDFMYNKDTALSKTGYPYGRGNNSHCYIDTHTYIHEMGHVFGLEDYYDYSYQYNPAGGFSMQDYNVGSHDPYSAMSLGWVTPYIPLNTSTYTLKPFQSSGDVILLTPSWNSRDSVFDEYLLLELYTPTGLNEMDSKYAYSSYDSKGPSETGIRVWHVDARLAYYASGSFRGPIVGLTNSNVTYAMSNSYYSSDSAAYVSCLGSAYYDYNLLQLIRNNTSATHKSNATISNNDLFKDGSSFSMGTFANQFVNYGKLNSKVSLGWNFSISISGNGENAIATVTCTKQ